MSQRSRPKLLLCVCFLLHGCIDEPATNIPQPTKSAPSHWKVIHGAKVVATDAETDAKITEAMAQARSTAETARARWSAASEIERDRWAIKWAAPTLSQQVEHVWVKPLNWSPFRIEGVLLSQPIAELECGKHEGGVVSFPIEELADWILVLEQSAEHAGREFEGGYTVRTIEDRFGKADH